MSNAKLIFKWNIFLNLGILKLKNYLKGTKFGAKKDMNIFTKILSNGNSEFKFG